MLHPLVPLLALAPLVPTARAPDSVSAATVSVDASAVIGRIAAIHNLTEGPITQSDWLVESGSTRPDKSSKNFSAGFLRAVRDYPPSPDSS